MQLFVKDLTVIDFSYLCPFRGMVGESWIVDVLLDGGLDEQNMVLDFAKVKRTIKSTIDAVCDHRLLVPVKHQACHIKQQAERTWVDFESQRGAIHLACPDQAFALIDTDVIDFESVNQYLQVALKQALPGNVASISLTLRTEVLEGAYYHYSHGLKKHDGNCQRIAHGHRSPITIFEQGIAAPLLDQYWANRWQDIYLAAVEDCVPVSSLTLSGQQADIEATHLGFHYQAPQGDFQLAMPKQCCDIIPHDTTVELLADFMAKELVKQNPTKQYKVIAFEGVGKGAIAVH